ncbi:hypothetical protein [Gordonia sp. IITR100]|uniref:hypothetical protein n=1 Tax=Gordonia sp. IITR100 TaxID=1314686 RepID=UPI0009911D0E|nr:hypothetical protein [Gordonia sp. IITR100]
MLADFGGLRGYITDPYGRRCMICLAPFDGADPDMYIELRFTEHPVQQGGHVPIRTGSFLLAEYRQPDPLISGSDSGK